MAKLKLDINSLEDDFFEGTRLLGIMSQLKNYRFCWLINNELNVDFRLNTDVEVQLKKKGRDYFFPVYYYCEPDSEKHHYVYSNQFEGEYLLPEVKHFDFLWLTKSDAINDQEFFSLQQQLKSITGVQLVTELTQEKIRNKENLII